MKSILPVFLLLLTVNAVRAQGSADPRTAAVSITDVLTRMPAYDDDNYQHNADKIAALGEDGLREMTLMLSVPGGADHVSLEYALAGYAYYTTKPGNETLRTAATRAFIDALAKTSDKENKAFIIRQLQVTAQEEAVPFLAIYLADERLCDPAARALVKINTPSAGQALLDALKNASDAGRLTIVQALGDSRFGPAAGTIATLIPSANPSLVKGCLYALARIGDPASASLLSKAAEKSAYTYDVTGATVAYTDYIHQLSLQGNQAAAEAKAVGLWKATRGDNQVAAHTTALKLLVDLRGEKSLPLLIQAMDEKNLSYREAALKFTLLFPGKNATAEWLVKLKASDKNKEVKKEIITMLGNSGQAEALPVLLEALKDIDEGVRLSAIKASGQIGQDQALPALLEVLKKNRPADCPAVKTSLLVMKGKGIPDAVGNALASMPAGAKAVLVDVLAARGADNRIGDVLSLLTSTDTLVRHAAYAALAPLATPALLPTLFTLLKNTQQPGEILEVQDAIAQASGLLNANTSKQALGMLYQQAGQSGLKSYVHFVNIAEIPAAQKLLLLRKAMEVAKTTAEKQTILEGVQNCQTFIAILFAGQYLDNADLQQQAAVDVMTIALSDTSWSGAVLRGLLEKTITVLKGKDSEAQKQNIRSYLAKMSAGEGLVAMFNGKDLSGWKGLVENPVARAKMDAPALQKAQEKADEEMRKSWFAKDGTLQFGGSGENLCTQKKYGDFEMYVDWKIDPDGDAGIYLRGSPQVQIWDTSRRDVGAQVGSGGLYNNAVYESKPLVLADNAIGDWNSFHIIMKGDRVTVYLNGVLVVDNIILENYWDRNLPIFPEEQIELQAHGRHVAYRDLYIKELPHAAPYVLAPEEKKDGFQLLFDGTNMFDWTGNTTEYNIEGDAIAVHPVGGNHGNLYTKKEYQDFVYRFEFQLTPGANNGIGIRAPLEGDAAYVGMEIQVLDNEADKYKDLHVYQYHGSVYGVIPAKRGFLKPVGEWNEEEITAIGNHIKVVLNGTTILDGDISDAIQHGTLDKKEHPGLKNVKGHLGFLGHGDVVRFRHMRVKDLSEVSPATAPASAKKKKK